jgi:serine/threonine protein kinase
MARRKTLTAGEVRFYMSQVLDGVEHIHMQKVIHRDLKLGNIFLADGLRVKIADFGYAIQLRSHSERRLSMCGTPNYIAPEILQGKEGPGHSYEVDIWAAGIVMFTLFSGTPPFQAQDGTLENTYANIRQHTMRPFLREKEGGPDATARELIQLMLHKDFRQRPPAAKLRSHPFLVA